MPRTSDVYSPPAGTKGTPNTTIESSKYNAFVDDLTTDANAARPITAGGTGATNATAARTALGTNDATNLTAGTLNDARLPATMSPKTFTDTMIIRGIAPIIEWRETDVVGTAAWYGVMDGLGLSFRYQSTGSIFLDMQPTGVFQWLGNTIWHAGNDGAGSGLDADLLDGQQGSYYANIPARLGYTPARQGGGSTVTFTWTGTALSLAVDATNFGTTWPISISGNASTATSATSATNATNAATADNANSLGGSAAALWLLKSSLRPELATIGVDEVGCVALLSRVTAGTFNQGDTSLGSQLRYSNIDGSNLSGSGPSGNWLHLSRCVGGAGITSVFFGRRIS